MKRIVVYNPKGGSGKSTIASNLAAYYAVNQRKVCLLDMDAQKSSLNWLNCRTGALPAIAGGLFRRDDFSALPADTAVIIDTPASLPVTEISDILHLASHLIIPLLPSAIDIRAAGFFLYQLLIKHRITAHDLPICLVANRVKNNSLAFKSLTSFLDTINVPFVTALRDSRNYLVAAETGCSIFDMNSKSTEIDRQQWLPLLAWLDDASSQATSPAVINA